MNNFLRQGCTGGFFAGLLISAQAEEFSRREKKIAAQHAVYVKPTHGITDKVLKIMNAQSIKYLNTGSISCVCCW